MKKILIVLPNVPYPLTSGGNIGVFEMVDFLRDHLNISLLVPNVVDSSLAELSRLWPNVTFHTYYRAISRKERLLRATSFKLLQTSIQLLGLSFRQKLRRSDIATYTDSLFFSYIHRDLVEKVNSLINKEEYDLVQVEFFKLLPLVAFFNGKVKTVFVHHELRYIRLQREFNTSLSKSMFRSFFEAQIKGIEIGFLRQYDQVVALSEIDRNLLIEELAPARVVCSPLTIRVEKSQSDYSYHFENTLLFIGGSTHSPNVDAIRAFVADCWPTLLKKKPELKLTIIGSWSDFAKQEFKDTPRIEFLGFVKDLGSVVKNGILIVPIRIGSGIRMKILDAVSLGVPFIATDVGVEGLNFVNGEECLIVANVKCFTDAVIRLVDDSDLQLSFIEKARRKLNQDYSFEQLTNARKKIYEKF